MAVIMGMAVMIVMPLRMGHALCPDGLGERPNRLSNCQMLYYTITQIDRSASRSLDTFQAKCRIKASPATSPAIDSTTEPNT